MAFLNLSFSKGSRDLYQCQPIGGSLNNMGGIPLVVVGKRREKGANSRMYVDVLGRAGLTQEGPLALRMGWNEHQQGLLEGAVCGVYDGLFVPQEGHTKTIAVIRATPQDQKDIV